MGKSWALGDQTLPLSRGTRNRRQEAVGKQEAQMLQAGKQQGEREGLRHGAKGGKGWRSYGPVLCGRLVILLF